MKNFIPDKSVVFDSDDDRSTIELENENGNLNESNLSDEPDVEDEVSFTTSDESDVDFDAPVSTDESDIDFGCDPTKKNTAEDNSSKKRSREEDSESDCSDDERSAVTMQDIFENKPNIEANREHPPNIKTTDEIFDICFDPVKEVLAIGDICGRCILYRYNSDSVDEIARFSHHTGSCRQVCFDEEGQILYTISSDMSLGIVDVANGALKSHRKNLHDFPISSFYELSNNVYATGDDEGTVKIWDSRMSGGVKMIDCSPEGKDSISSLLSSSREDYLCATCRDGSITGINLKKMKIEAQSEMYNNEFTSQSLLKFEKKLVVANDKTPGGFKIFNWGSFGYHSDSFRGIPSGILSQACVSENLVFAGCDDGTIRAINFFPHRLLGTVGQHLDGSGVESLAVSHDGDLLASSANDNQVQFWNISAISKAKIVEGKKSHKKLAIAKQLTSSRVRNTKDFFRDVPIRMESDDEGGPVAGCSFQDIDSD